MAKGGKQRGKIKSRDKKTGKGIAERKPEKVSVDNLSPHFCFAHLQRSHCIQNCDKDERAALADKMRALCQCNWRDLRQAPRHGMGYEKIARDALNVPIPRHLTEEVDILAFRFFGKAPIVGYRVDRVFHVVWVDRAFDVYDHGS